MYRLLFAIMIGLFTFTAYAETAPANPFTLTTNAFLDQGALPVVYTCDGKDVSPQFEWSGAPDKTQSFAFIMLDPNTSKGIFYHWILYNIPKSVSALPEGKIPAGITVGKNGMNKVQYKGPCPPKGAAHNYIFTLYALDTKLTLESGADANAVLAAMQNHIISKTQLTAVYSRWIN